MYKRKGGISAPVLAILTFAVLLVVGVAILMYFYVIAPQVSHQSQLSVLGEPVIRRGTYNGNDAYNLTVTLKNIGSDTIDISGATIIVPQDSTNKSVYTEEIVATSTIAPGEAKTIVIIWLKDDVGDLQANQIYTVILQTNFGNFEFSAIYRG